MNDRVEIRTGLEGTKGKKAPGITFDINPPLTLKCSSLLETSSPGGVTGFHTYGTPLPARGLVCTS